MHWPPLSTASRRGYAIRGRGLWFLVFGLWSLGFGLKSLVVGISNSGSQISKADWRPKSKIQRPNDLFDTAYRPAYHPNAIVGAWLSLVERTVRDREVGGSNPLAPTNYINTLRLPPLAAVFRLCPICAHFFRPKQLDV